MRTTFDQVVTWLGEEVTDVCGVGTCSGGGDSHNNEAGISDRTGGTYGSEGGANGVTDATDATGANGSEVTIDGVSTDTRTLAPGNLYIPLVGERFDGHAFIEQAVQAGAAAVVCQSDHTAVDVPLGCPVVYVGDTLRALQKLAHAYRRHTDARIVAVTGSNGKTTTKDLLAAVLRTTFNVHKTAGNLNNHIGLPLTILAMPEETDVAVLEMGMNHPGEISLLSRLAEPDIAVITNIGDAHIEFFGERRGIARAKLEIVDGLAAGGVLFINGDDDLLPEETAELKNPVYKVGLEEQSQVSASETEETEETVESDAGTACGEAPITNERRRFGAGTQKQGGGFAWTARELETLGTRGTRFTTSDGCHYELPLLGAHNVRNALLALAVGRYMGVTREALQEGLRTASISGGRLQLVESTSGMWVIDDSYNANPTAVRAAIDTLVALPGKEEKWALLGDIFELGAHEEALHRELGAYACDRGVDRLFTVGMRGRWIYDAAKEAKGDSTMIAHFDTVDEAIHAIGELQSARAALLVKASRGMALERVVKQLCNPATSR